MFRPIPLSVALMGWVNSIGCIEPSLPLSSPRRSLFPPYPARGRCPPVKGIELCLFVDPPVRTISIRSSHLPVGSDPELPLPRTPCTCSADLRITKSGATDPPPCWAEHRLRLGRGPLRGDFPQESEYHCGRTEVRYIIGERAVGIPRPSRRHEVCGRHPNQGRDAKERVLVLTDRGRVGSQG